MNKSIIYRLETDVKNLLQQTTRIYFRKLPGNNFCSIVEVFFSDITLCYKILVNYVLLLLIKL